MASMVLDSWALMALFHDEPSAGKVEELLWEASREHHLLLLCVVNWGEIYYSVMRTEGQAVADRRTAEIASLPIELAPVDADLALVRQAAIFKATKTLSYADAFAAALAKLRHAILVTGDPEFKSLENEIKIRWLN